MSDSDRRFRFSIGMDFTNRKTIAESAKQAEDLGYSVINAPDHFVVPIEPFLALYVAAEATTTIRLGTLVIDNDFRHPAVLAKQAATLDLLSDGRLELGIGAGWMKSEYEQTGIAYESPRIRVERLGESLEVLTGLFADGPFSFRGKYYTINEHNGLPKPVQRPRPTIQLGGGGRVILGLAGRFADSVSIAPRTGPSGQIEGNNARISDIPDKIKWISDAAGSRMSEIELGVPLFNVTITEDREGTAEQMLAAFRRPGGMFNVPADFTVEDLLSSPFFAIGTSKQLSERCVELREQFGLSHFAVLSPDPRVFAPVIEALKGS